MFRDRQGAGWGLKAGKARGLANYSRPIIILLICISGVQQLRYLQSHISSNDMQGESVKEGLDDFDRVGKDADTGPESESLGIGTAPTAGPFHPFEAPAIVSRYRSRLANEGLEGDSYADDVEGFGIGDVDIATAPLIAPGHGTEGGEGLSQRTNRRHHRHRHGGNGEELADPPFFHINTGRPGGIGLPSFDNWTIYLHDTTPLLLHQAQFDMPGARRGGDLNENRAPHSALLRYTLGADGLLAEWDPAIDKEGKATEVKLLYPSEVISKLPHSDTPLMYSTCALVSNSGSLLEGRFGQEIDEHDAVFRMNNAPTIGFERYVGSKTTFDLLNRPHADEVSRMRIEGTAESLPQVAAVLFEADNWHLYHHILERQLKHMPYPSTLVLAPRFLDRVNALWMRLAKRWPRFANSCTGIKRAAMQGDVSNRCQKMLRDCQNDVCKPSSGFFALMMAAQMCNSIDMYGFESYQKATGIKHKSTPYHYFDEEEGTTDVHSFILIMKVFEFLSHRYPIVIKTPTYGAEKERRKEFQEKAARMRDKGQQAPGAKVDKSQQPQVTTKVQAGRLPEAEDTKGKGGGAASKAKPWMKNHFKAKHHAETLLQSFAGMLERVDTSSRRPPK